MTARRPTSADVASLSGVSRATVSYVLNNDPRQSISEETRNRVLEAARQLNYVPSASAANLRRGRSNIVLLVTDPLFSEHVGDNIVNSTADRLKQEGYFVLRHVQTEPESIIEVAKEVAAVGVLSLTFLTPTIRKQLQDVGVKRILDIEISETLTGLPDRPWEYPVGQLQVDHLASRGYTSLYYALPLNSPRLPIAMARLHGVEMECASLGLEQPRILSLPLDRESIAKELAVIEREEFKTAICAYDDQIAIGVLGAMADLGWKVGKDLGVIGCDDLPVSSLMNPPLTTIYTKASVVGINAAEAFLELKDGELKFLEETMYELFYSIRVRSST